MKDIFSLGFNQYKLYKINPLNIDNLSTNKALQLLSHFLLLLRSTPYAMNIFTRKFHKTKCYFLLVKTLGEFQDKYLQQIPCSLPATPVPNSKYNQVFPSCSKSNISFTDHDLYCQPTKNWKALFQVVPKSRYQHSLFSSGLPAFYLAPFFKETSPVLSLSPVMSATNDLVRKWKILKNQKDIKWKWGLKVALQAPTIKKLQAKIHDIKKRYYLWKLTPLHWHNHLLDSLEWSSTGIYDAYDIAGCYPFNGTTSANSQIFLKNLSLVHMNLNVPFFLS